MRPSSKGGRILFCNEDLIERGKFYFFKYFFNFFYLQHPHLHHPKQGTVDICVWHNLRFIKDVSGGLAVHGHWGLCPAAQLTFLPLTIFLTAAIESDFTVYGFV